MFLHACDELQTTPWRAPAEGEENGNSWPSVVFWVDNGDGWCWTAVRKMEVRRKYTVLGAAWRRQQTQLVHRMIETGCYSSIIHRCLSTGLFSQLYADISNCLSMQMTPSEWHKHSQTQDTTHTPNNIRPTTTYDILFTPKLFWNTSRTHECTHTGTFNVFFRSSY